MHRAGHKLRQQRNLTEKANDCLSKRMPQRTRNSTLGKQAQKCPPTRSRHQGPHKDSSIYSYYANRRVYLYFFFSRSVSKLAGVGGREASANNADPPPALRPKWQQHAAFACTQARTAQCWYKSHSKLRLVYQTVVPTLACSRCLPILHHFLDTKGALSTHRYKYSVT